MFLSLIDHRKRPITGRIVFSLLYKFEIDNDKGTNQICRFEIDNYERTNKISGFKTDI